MTVDILIAIRNSLENIHIRFYSNSKHIFHKLCKMLRILCSRKFKRNL